MRNWTISFENLGIPDTVEVEADENYTARRAGAEKLSSERPNDPFISRLTVGALANAATVRRHKDRRKVHDY